MPAPRRWDWLVALAASLLALGLWGMRADWAWLEALDRASLDLQLRVRGRIAPQAPISLIAIDDRSLQELGGVAPTRAQHAQLLRQARAAGARVVALDLLLLEPDPADAELAAALRQPGLRSALPLALPLEALGPAVEAPGALLPHAFMRARAEPEALSALALRPQGMQLPAAELLAAAGLVGHVTVRRSGDGAVPYDLPALPWQGEWLPSLALRLAGEWRGLHWSQAEFVAGQGLRWGELELPLDPLSRQWVNYYGPAGSFASHSYVDLLRGRLKPELLRGRLLIVGATALGTGDQFPSPFDAGLPGVERLATVTDNLISGRVLQRAAAAPLIEIAAMLLLPAFSLALFASGSARRALGLLALLGLALLALAQWDFVRTGRVLSLAFPLLALGAAVLGSALLRSHQERLRKQAALQALRASEERYALAARGANDGLWDWDLDAGSFFLSERARGLLGDPAQARIEAFGALLDANGRAAFEGALQDHLQGRSLQLHHVLQFREGEQERALLVRGMATRDAAGRPQRMAGSISDISDTLRLQRQLVHDALHDRLTGLANRALFFERLEQLLADGGEVGVVLLGLDGFRALNEAEGTQMGDRVLRELGRRISALGGNDCPVARFGPDQFALAFRAPLQPGGQDAGHHPDAVLALLERPLPGLNQALAGTVGWAHSAQGPQGAEELLACAELALALAKARQRGTVRAYDAADQLLENSRRWLRENLDLALAEGQLQMFYQPLVRLSDRRLLGFEALIRWQHPQRGWIMPGDFIPFAEESGQIVAIGRWTLLAVAEQLRLWDAQGFDGEIAVNLSSRQFTEGDLQADARELLARLGAVDPHRVKLEVTESMAMANPHQTAAALQALAGMGFKISIDDFGTGYSSLAYLHQFPFDTLKIDRSFVMRLHQGRDAVEIVRTIVGLTRALDKQALAEGVEEERQAQLLHELGVQIGQGWLFGKALPVDQAEALIERCGQQQGLLLAPA